MTSLALGAALAPAASLPAAPPGATTGGMGGPEGGAARFARTLAAVSGPTPAETSTIEAVKAAGVAAAPPSAVTRPVSGSPRPQAVAKPPSLVRALDALTDSQTRMQKVVELALSGRQFSPQELLALQAGVYRFSQELDLAGKVLEKVTSGVKQTLGIQV